MTKELKTIHHREDAVVAAPKLKHLFNDLVDVMLAAREQQKKSNSSDESRKHEFSFSDQLRAEMNRVYAIEGVREVIEKSQEEALHRL
ncbi:MAG: hypothetical protein H0X51_05615 [Parachlamydiaceae bacterium]|nr:hypothetical protein [Parachlamydiaceae bacterium]